MAEAFVNAPGSERCRSLASVWFRCPSDASPIPWFVEETTPCFIVRDASGQALAYVYCEHEPGRRAAVNLLSRDEARRIAANIAKLPKLLSGDSTS
jgi:hypothetical protein